MCKNEAQHTPKLIGCLVEWSVDGKRTRPTSSTTLKRKSHILNSSVIPKLTVFGAAERREKSRNEINTDKEEVEK